MLISYFDSLQESFKCMKKPTSESQSYPGRASLNTVLKE